MNAIPQLESDSILSAIDDLRGRLDALRDQVIREQEARSRFHVVQGEPINDEISAREAAEMIGVSRAALSNGTGGTACLRRRAIKRGDGQYSPVYFRRAWVLRHIRLRQDRGRCDGSCCEEPKAKLKGI